MRSIWSLGALALGAAGVIVAQETPRPGRTEIHGTVTDEQGSPIYGAEVIVLTPRATASTDSAGRYHLAGAPGGRVAVAARAIGFKLWHEPVTLSEGSDRRLDITLVRAPQVLSEINVMAPIPDALTAAYHRSVLRGSLLLTRKDIERRPIVRTFETLMGIPGVHVAWNPPGVGGTEVKFVRCGDPRRVAVWIDGQKAPEIGEGAGSGVARGRIRDPQAGAGGDTPSMELIEQMNAVDPSEIEAIEVFRGVSEIPAEFADQHSCAAIAIWTKTSWR